MLDLFFCKHNYVDKKNLIWYNISKGGFYGVCINGFDATIYVAIGLGFLSFIIFRFIGLAIEEAEEREQRLKSEFRKETKKQLIEKEEKK